MTCPPTCPLTLSEQHRLIEKWSGLPAHVARRLLCRADVQHLGMDEAVSAGNVGLVRAAAYFDPAREVAFQSYAYTVIVRVIIRTAQAWRRGGANLSLDVQVTPDGLTLAEELAAPQGLDLADVVDARDAVATLPDRDRFIIDRRCHGATLAEVAGSVGVTRERVRQIEQKARRKLREALT
jgi:RNA polymerase sigma factor (sigma-70 family)